MRACAWLVVREAAQLREVAMWAVAVRGRCLWCARSSSALHAIMP